MDDNRKKALEAALAQIEKQFGKGAIMKMTPGMQVPDVEVISTGSLTLDTALGIGGLPRGRVVEIYGPESSGKTTLTMPAVAESQKVGGVAPFIAAAHAIDIGDTQRPGVQVEDQIGSESGRERDFSKVWITG